MKAITVKYYGPTNTKSARLKAFDSDGHSITVSRHGENEMKEGIDLFASAAIALCKKMGWTGSLIAGGMKGCEVFVFADSDRYEIK